MLLQAEQMYKMTSISLKMVKVVILSENSFHFVICSDKTLLHNENSPITDPITEMGVAHTVG
jgi:hypothetical protein